MKFEVHHYHHFPRTEEGQQLARMETIMLAINERTKIMSLDLSNVLRELSELGVAISDLSQRLLDNGDQAAINEIAAQLDTHGRAITALAAPAADPVPAPAPTEEPVV